MRRIASYTDLANCVAWFDTFAGLTVGGGVLSSWSDQSGAGISGPATIANAISSGLANAVGPTYTASDSDFGGRPSLTWGSGETVLDTAVFAADLSPPLTLIVCGKSDGVVASQGPTLVSGPNALVAARRCQVSISAGSVLTALGITASANWLIQAMGPTGGSNYNLLAPITTTSPFIAAVSCSTGGDIRWVLNRQPYRSPRMPAGTPRTQGGWRFGRAGLNTTTQAYWSGKFNAFVCYNRLLSDGEALKAIDLMARRQGVSFTARTAKTRTAVPVPGAVGGRTWLL